MVTNLCSRLDIAPEFHFVDSVRAIPLYAEAGMGASVVPKTVIDVYQSTFLCSYNLSNDDEFLCATAAWHTENQSHLRPLLLEEFEKLTGHCSSYIDDWCRMYNGSKHS